MALCRQPQGSIWQQRPAGERVVAYMGQVQVRTANCAAGNPELAKRLRRDMALRPSTDGQDTARL